MRERDGIAGGRGEAVIEDDRLTSVAHAARLGRGNYRFPIALGVATVAVAAAGLLGNRAVAGLEPALPSLAALAPATPTTQPSPSPTLSAPSPSAPPSAPIHQLPVSTRQVAEALGLQEVRPDPARIRLVDLPDGTDLSSLAAAGSRLYFVVQGAGGQASVQTLDVASPGRSARVFAVPACHTVPALHARGDRVLIVDVAVGLEAGCEVAEAVEWKAWLVERDGSRRVIASGEYATPGSPGSWRTWPMALGDEAFAIVAPAPAGSPERIEVRTFEGTLLWAVNAPGEVAAISLGGSTRLAATVICPDPSVQAEDDGTSARLSPSNEEASGEAGAVGRTRTDSGASAIEPGTVRPGLMEIGWAEVVDTDLRLIGQAETTPELTADGSTLLWLDGAAAVRAASLPGGVQWTPYGVAGIDRSWLPDGAPPYLGAVSAGMDGVGWFGAWLVSAGDTSFVVYGDGHTRPSAFRPDGAVQWISAQDGLLLWTAATDGGAVAGAVEVAALAFPQ